jgi:hypothetical protein
VNLAYDLRRERHVLWASGTWEYDGDTWTHPTPPTLPTALTGGCVTYDGGSDRVVYIGGNTGPGSVPMATMWSWDGTDWSLAPGPSARMRAGAVYDAFRGRIVVFGGLTRSISGGELTYLDDTWEY